MKQTETIALHEPSLGHFELRLMTLSASPFNQHNGKLIAECPSEELAELVFDALDELSQSTAGGIDWDEAFGVHR